MSTWKLSTAAKWTDYIMNKNSMPTIKHTPGPWKAQSRCASDGTLVVKDSAFDEICVVREKALRDYTDEDKKHVANARLIAAAPTLLETLQEIRCWLTSPDLSSSVIAAYQHDCELAIEKATGEKYVR